MQIRIATSWDGQPLADEEQVILAVRRQADQLCIEIDAPYYGDPYPNQPPGPCDQLWEFEVVELFWFGAEQRYLEFELGPAGHYLLWEFAGVRNKVAEHSIARPATQVEGDRWFGRALIPVERLPIGLYGVNAFALSGASDRRKYRAAAPAVGDLAGPAPDFHRLDCYLPFET